MRKQIKLDPQKLQVLVILRETAGLTQSQAARHLGLTGKRSRDTVSAWESGKFRPSPDKRADFLNYLTDQLGLRRNSEQLRRVWAEVMVDQWQWEPLTPTEWGQVFRGRPLPAHLAKLESSDKNSIPHLVDWGQAPDIHHFYGRYPELEQLIDWIAVDQCRLVAVLGLGGIGKTTLVTKLAHQLQADFDILIWRSLSNAPPIDELLQGYLYLLSNPMNSDLPKALDQQIVYLLECLRAQRCLLVLDNLETILQEGKAVGRYRPEYEAYGQLIRAIGETHHQSCLVLTSREKPPELALLEGNTSPARSLKLTGLPTAASQQLLDDKNLIGAEAEWQDLVDRFSGNPLLLKLAADLIQEIFDGRLTEFLDEYTGSLGDVRYVLDQQFERLSAVEQEVMFWLAIEREVVSRTLLQENMLRIPSKKQLVDALNMLLRRSLVEKSDSGFVFQNVVLEYVTERLIEQICQEVENLSPSILCTHALIKAQAKDHLRESQTRLILTPIVERLRDTLGQETLETRLNQMLAELRNLPINQTSYAAGNILNLLIELESDLDTFDFSNLTIRQAYLADVTLHNVNFAGAEIRETVFQDTFGGTPALAFSPNGVRLAAGTTTGEVRVLDSDNGTLLLSCSSGQWLKSIDFSPDGHFVASCGADPIVRIWNANSGICLHQLAGHTNRLRAVAFSPDGRWLASGGADLFIRIWDVETGECLKTLLGHEGWILSLAFDKDGEMLASSSKDGTIRLWQIRDGHCRQVLAEHTGWVNAVAFSPAANLLASGSNDYTVRLWNSNTGALLKTWSEHIDQVKAVAFGPDGRWVASGGNDRTVRLWPIDATRSFRTLQGHTGWVEAVVFSPDGHRLATGGYDQSLRLWDVQSGQCVRSWQSHTPWLDDLAFSPDGRTLASSGNQHVNGLWHIHTGQFQSLVTKENRWLWAAAFSPDGRLLANGGYGYVVQLWDAKTGHALFQLTGHRDWVRTVAFSPDGRLLASGSEDHTIRLWDIERRQCMQVLSEHTGRVRTVAFSPDGKLLASGSADQTVRLWDTDSGLMLRILQGHEDWVFSVVFTPNGQNLISGSADQTVRLWRAADGQCLTTLSGHTGPIRSVAMSSDGQLIASGSADQTVRLWDISSGQVLHTLSGHEEWVKAVAFGPDGHQLASASGDGVVMLWDVTTGQYIQILRPDRPYERLNIAGVKGLTGAQITALKALGALQELDVID